MQLSDKMKTIPHCHQNKPKSSLNPKNCQASSFNQSTLFSLNNSSFLNNQSTLRGTKKHHVETNCVTFVEESFLSHNQSQEDQLQNKKEKKPKSNHKQVKANHKKSKKKSKYNFMKKIITVGKKKLNNAKKFFMKMGNNKQKNPKRQSQNKSSYKR
jgi:hypothetical protein